MKKLITLLLIILIFSIMSGNSWSCSSAEEEVQTSPTPTPTQTKEVIFTNLGDALGSKNSLKCTYQYEDQESSYQGTIYMKDDKFRTNMDIGDKKINSLYDGKVYYSWIDGEAQGFKMDADCLEEVSKEDVKTEEFDPKESFFSVKDFDSTFEVQCEKADFDLGLPKDVEFQDMCEILRNLIKAFESMNIDQ